MRLGDVIFLLLVLISFLNDLKLEKTKQCVKMNNKVLFILFFHHIISIYGLFGWMLSSLNLVRLYVISIPILILYWFIVKDCQISVYTNQLCKWDSDYKFNHIFKPFGVSSNILYILAIIGFIIAFKRISKYNSTGQFMNIL
jgi:hypothetical protein